MITRKRVYEIVEVAAPGDRASRLFDVSIMALIFLNVGAIIAETMKPLYKPPAGQLDLSTWFR